MSCTDFPSTLGPAFLARRFRGASELLLEGSGTFLAAHGFHAPPRSASMMHLLRERGPLSITEIARALRLSHPLIIKLAAALAAKRLVEERQDPLDQRRRLIALTRQGRAQAERLAELSRVVGAAYRELGNEIGVDLTKMFERLEAALATRSIEQRLNDSLAAHEPAAASTMTDEPGKALQCRES